jgi:hypothetical protein
MQHGLHGRSGSVLAGRRRPVGKELQRDEAAERSVLRFIDDAHTAAAEFINDVVVRDGPADK